MSKDTRVPTTVWASTSWPWPVVPSQWFHDGSCSGTPTIASGSPTSHGPITPSSTKPAMSTKPIVALRSRRIASHQASRATRRHSEGDQAKYIKGVAGEAEQQRFYDQFTAWIREARIPSTYFEAFDENWKGGPHPDEVEKHWGLFRTDRTPKPALAR